MRMEVVVNLLPELIGMSEIQALEKGSSSIMSNEAWLTEPDLAVRKFHVQDFQFLHPD